MGTPLEKKHHFIPPDDDGDGSSGHCCRNRRHKPPNLNIATARVQARNCIHSRSSESGEDTPSLPEVSPSDSGSFVVLRKQRISTLDAGAALNSPLIKRASRLDHILEIPDVAAALVRDEGYELLMHSRRLSIEHASKRRQQTPVPSVEDKSRFVFDDSPVSTPDADSESTSGSDSSSVQSAPDAVTPTPSKPANEKRPRMKPLKLSAAEMADTEEVYKLISDSRRASDTFTEKTPASSGERRPPSPYTAKLSQAVDESNAGNVSPASEPDLSSKGSKKRLLSRFKSSLSRSTSTSSLQGWDALVRALARVGVDTEALWGIEMEPEDVNPVVTPILKRRSHQGRLYSDGSVESVQVICGVVSRVKGDAFHACVPCDGSIASKFI